MLSGLLSQSDSLVGKDNGAPMNNLFLAVFVFIGVGVSVWLVSFILEALRRAPEEPKRLAWAPDITIDYLTVNGNRLRYIRTGRGPIVVLLHTLRTQLDLFEKIVPDLARDFTVYAVDYPGHGYSDIPYRTRARSRPNTGR